MKYLIYYYWLFLGGLAYSTQSDKININLSISLSYLKTGKLNGSTMTSQLLSLTM